MGEEAEDIHSGGKNNKSAVSIKFEVHFVK